MASYCEVCQMGVNTTPHTHGLSPVLPSGSSPRGPSPLRGGRLDGGLTGTTSPARPQRQTSPYRSLSSSLPRPRQGTSPLERHTRTHSSQRYTRNTYNSEARRSATSSPLRNENEDGSALAYTTSQNGAGDALSRATEVALNHVLDQMRASPASRFHADAARTDPPVRSTHTHADRYRYTRAQLPPRHPAELSPHPYDDVGDLPAAPPNPPWASSSSSSMGPAAAYARPSPHALEPSTPLFGAAGEDGAPVGHTTPVAAQTHGEDREKRKAVDDSNERDGVGARQARLRQSEWQQAITARVDELRAGFVDLCAAVKKDIHALEARFQSHLSGAGLGTAASASSAQRPPRASPPTNGEPRRRLDSSLGDRSPGSCDRPTRESSPFTTGTNEEEGGGPRHTPLAVFDRPAVTLPTLTALVRAASASDRRHLAKALWADLKPFVEKEVQQRREKDERHFSALAKNVREDVRAQVHEECVRIAGTVPPPSQQVANTTLTPDLVRSLLPMDFSSPEALEAHLRVVARQVLAEEDAQRYGQASHNERRHAESWLSQQESWRTELKRAERDWRREYTEAMAVERKTWARQDMNEVHRELNRMHQLVEAVTHDMSDLTRQVTDAQARQVSWMESESQRRRREEVQAHSALKTQLTRMLQEHQQAQQREQTVSHGPSCVPRSLLDAQTSAVTCDAMRTEVVEPALTHMKRLLVAHQKVIDATVERRCALAVQSVDDRQHIWEQHVTELRTKINSLRTDVRNAFAEMSQKLNVAAPGL